jgi:dCMP deaminase
MDSRINILKEGEIGSRPNWDEYFMHLAIGISSRATCHNVQAGTVIISDNQIVGTGYNGAPSKIKNNCLITGCRKELKGLLYENSLGSGECIGVHSEMNALGHLTKLNNKKISVYVTVFPCHSCAKNLLSYDLDKVVFKKLYSEKEMKSTMDLFEESGVNVYQLDLSRARYDDIANGKKVKFGVWD